MADPIRTLGLFSGIGGLELAVAAGLRSVGRDHRLVGLVEGEAFGCACLVAAMERGDLAPAPVWLGDVREFPAAAFRGAVDLVVGGFPCNDTSRASRTSEGIDGQKSGLWSEVVRVARDVGARYVFVENTATLVSRGLDRVLADLASLGFDAEWEVVEAAHVGAPHIRARLFLLAYSGSQRHGAPDHALRTRRTGALVRPRWPDEPDVARVDAGAPDAVDRRRALGNMVCPQQGAAAFAELWRRIHGGE